MYRVVLIGAMLLTGSSSSLLRAQVPWMTEQLRHASELRARGPAGPTAEKAGGDIQSYRPLADYSDTAAAAPARDHRWEGLAIGAIVLGAGAAFIGSRLCENNESCTGTTIGFGLIGATIGSVVGAFIGAAIPKEGGN